MIPVNKNPEYFLAVAETRSISKAAAKLFVSQPYLSRHVIRLEKDLGVRLLNREKVPLSLTPAGEIYARYLESSRQMLRKLEQDLEAVSGQSRRTLRLGFSNWRAGTLLPEVIPGFLSAYPDVSLELTEVPNNQLYRLIAEDKIDFAIMNVSADLPDYVTAETMMYEKILLAGNRRDPAAAALLEQKNAGLSPDLHLLEEARVIMLPPDTALASRAGNYLDKQHIILRNVIRTSNASTALILTAQNLGFCFLNETGVHAAPNAADLLFFDPGSDDLIYPLCVVYKKKSFLTPMVRAGIDMMTDFYRTRYQKSFTIS